MTISGLPNILTLRGMNGLGLWQEVVSGAIVVDTTPPLAGQVTCPAHIKVNQKLIGQF